jgi:hypothetical protein
MDVGMFPACVALSVWQEEELRQHLLRKCLHDPAEILRNLGHHLHGREVSGDQQQLQQVIYSCS